jgi:hypothetical protein
VTTPAPFVIAQSIPPLGGSTPSPTPSVAEQILSALGTGRSTVSRQDQAQVVDLLRNDPDLNATLRELAANPTGAGASGLADMIRRVDIPDVRRDMIDLLARGADDANAQAIRRGLDGMDVQYPYGAHAPATSDQVWQIRFNLVRLGVPTSGPTFNRAPYAGLVSSDPYAPFTGVGATGVNPTELSLTTANQLGMAVLPDAHRNPVSSLSGYLQGLSSADRVRQAELFLNQPISTPFREVWGSTPPSRAQVIEVAARQYNLHPNVVAGFLLAEQRDQSRIEDAADMYSAWYGRDASIGLGQVTMSTGNRGVLADSVSGEVSRAAGYSSGMSRLLADDATNIFAAARYIRQVADSGANISMSTLEARTLAAQQAAAAKDGLPVPTQSTYTTAASMFPGFNPSAYSLHSSQWPASNIAALGSEYTSRAWDGRWSAWGNFVLEAHNDVRASQVFRP